MKTIADILINCSVKGRIILMPKKGINEILFLRFKELMSDYGGEYYPSYINKGFVFRKFNAKTKQTENLLNKLITKYNVIKHENTTKQKTKSVK